MGKSSKKTATQTTTPNQPLLGAYQNLIGQAQAQANQPLQLYQGNTVAPFSDLQNQAFGQIQGAQDLAQPYLNTASNLINTGASAIMAPGQLNNAGIAQGINSATGLANQAGNTQIWSQLPQFNASTVNQYLSPYTQDVVNATQRQFDLQNAQQQNALAGSAAAAGAFGGDRQAVAQAQLAGQQQTAQAPVIAGLNQAGYNTALGEFNAQQAAQQAAIGQQAGIENTAAGTQYGIAAGQQQAGLGAAEASASNALYGGYGVSGLANEALNTSLTGSSALLNAGSLQQQLAQENLNVPYEQYLQTQAYPYQQADFLAGILGSSNVGQTTNETSSQTQPFSLFHRGGVPRRAIGGGGLAYSPYTMFEAGIGQTPDQSGGIAAGVPSIAAAPPNLGAGYIPATTPGRGGDAPGTAGMAPLDSGSSQQQPGLVSQAATGAKDYSALSGLFDSSSSGIPLVSVTPQVTETGGFLGGIGNSGFLGLDGTGGLLDEGAAAASSAAPGIGGFISSAGSALADAATAALAFVGLEKGGRARGYDGGGIADGFDPATSDWEGSSPVTSDGTMLSKDQTPADWQGIATHTAPSQDESFWQRIGFAQQPGTGEGLDYRPGSPGWGRALLTGIGDALAHRSLGAGIVGGLDEYSREEDLDRHPEIDHSGETIRIFYPSEKKWIDTNLPTDTAINARTMAQYREDSLNERRDYHDESEQQRQQDEVDREADRQTQLEIAKTNSQAGRYTPVPGVGMDASGNQVPGVYVMNGKTGNMDFRPGVVLTDRQPQVKPPSPMSQAQATENAQRDYDRAFPKPTDPTQPRQAPPEGMLTWVQRRAQAYLGGGSQAAPAPAPATSSAPQGTPPAGSSPAPSGPPPLPANLSAGAQWSPSRRQWRDSKNRVYNADGTPAQ